MRPPTLIMGIDEETLSYAPLSSKVERL